MWSVLRASNKNKILSMFLHSSFGASCDSQTVTQRHLVLVRLRSRMDDNIKMDFSVGIDANRP